MTWPTLHVEVALGIGGPGGYMVLDDPALGLLDTGILGPDLVWTDITAYCRSIRTQSAQRDRSVAAYSAGTATVLLADTDGRFDPSNITSPYFQTGRTTLTANRPFRVYATVDADVFGGFVGGPGPSPFIMPMFYGYTNAWQPGGNQRTNDQWCTLTATDGFKLLGRNNPTAQGAVGASELSGARITRILDNAGWPADLRRISAGQSGLQSTTLAANTLAELQLVTASEGGTLFIDATGSVVFRDRYFYATDFSSTNSAVTFVDAGSVGATTIVILKMDEAEVRSDDDLLYNKIALGRAGGTVQTVQDADSIAAYSAGVASGWGRSDLLNLTDQEVADQAAWLLARYKKPENRFASVTLRPESENDVATRKVAWEYALGLGISRRITLQRKRRGTTQFTQDVFVEGVTNDISISDNGVLDWSVVLSTSSTTGYGDFMVLDSAQFGVLDTNLLGY